MPSTLSGSWCSRSPSSRRGRSTRSQKRLRDDRLYYLALGRGPMDRVALRHAPSDKPMKLTVAYGAPFRSAEMRRIRPFPPPFAKKGLHVAHLHAAAAPDGVEAFRAALRLNRSCPWTSRAPYPPAGMADEPRGRRPR